VSSKTQTKIPSSIITLAIILIMGGVFYRQAAFYRNVQWQAPTLQAAVFRGEDGNPRQPVYAQDALASLYKGLTTAVVASFDQAKPAPRKLVLFGQKFGYSMNASMNELFDGALQVDIAATAAGAASPAKTWTQTIEKGSDAAKLLADFGGKVGAELAGLK
jgi:hypothetical protein